MTLKMPVKLRATNIKWALNAARQLYYTSVIHSLSPFLNNIMISDAIDYKIHHYFTYY